MQKLNVLHGHIEAQGTDKGAIATLRVTHDDVDEVFTGASKTHPDDMPGVPTIGTALAAARAFREAARFYQRLAYQQVRVAAETREAMKRYGEGDRTLWTKIPSTRSSSSS